MIFNDEIKEYKLDNGLKIIFQHYPGTSSATFMIWYKVGSSDEVTGKTGLSHFLEHLSFKETELFKKGQIVSEITRNGGVFNAYTGKDFTCYYETFATSRLELAILIESQRMNKLVIDDNDRKIEIGIILSELEKGLDNPYSALGNKIRTAAYPDCSYGHPIVGVEKDVENTKLEDLKAHHSKYYVPNNATIVITGNFDEQQTLKMIEKHFGSIPSSKEIFNTNPRKFKKQNGLKRVKIEKNGPSPIVKLAYHIPPANHPDIYALIVLAEMLNIGMSSRFYKSMVETRIATDINVNAEILKHPALFTVLCTLYPDSTHDLAEQSILEQIENLITYNLPTEEELKKTKRRIKSSFEFNKDGTFKLAYLLGYYETIESLQFIENYIKNINRTTVSDIIRAVKNYLTLDNCTIGYFIPQSGNNHKISTDYKPEHSIPPNLKFSAPPIILTEKITNKPLCFNKKTLPNGIKIIVCENKTNDTVKLYGSLSAGNLYAANLNPVLPVICGGMLNRGTQKMTKLQIAEIIESKGAYTGISNVGESVNFSLSSLSEDFASTLAFLSEMIRIPSFPEDEFDKYKKYALAGLKQKENNPSYLALAEFTRQIYPATHIYYSYPLKEQEKFLEQITLNEVKDFYEKFYTPNDMILAIAGNISADKAFKLIEENFGNWTKNSVDFPILEKVNFNKTEIKKTISVEDKIETDVIFGHYGNLTRNNPDYYAASAMNFILGGGGALSSRIGRKMREELGLVYSISSSFTSSKTAGSWSAKYAIDNKHLDISLEALKQEINNFIKYGATKEELENAKSYIIGSHPLKFSSNTGIARSLLMKEYYNLEDDYLDKYPEIIEALTNREILAAANKYLHPDKAITIIAGSI